MGKKLYWKSVWTLHTSAMYVYIYIYIYREREREIDRERESNMCQRLWWSNTGYTPYMNDALLTLWRCAVSIRMMPIWHSRTIPFIRHAFRCERCVQSMRGFWNARTHVTALHVHTHDVKPTLNTTQISQTLGNFFLNHWPRRKFLFGLIVYLTMLYEVLVLIWWGSSTNNLWFCYFVVLYQVPREKLT
jgi:hypothetical protein